MEDTLKAHLLCILEDLVEDELARFKFQLTNIVLAEGYKHIPRGTLQLATPVMLADKLIQFYGEEYCKTVTKDVLNAINQRNLAEKFCQSLEKSEKKKKKRKQENEAGQDGDKGQLKKLIKIFNPKKTPNESTSYPRDPQRSNHKEAATKNQRFPDLIRRLNLDNYYPKKMTKVNTFLISKTSLHGTQPKAEGELPFCFLEKLLVLDYHFRYLVYRDNTETLSTVPQALRTTELGGTLEDFFIIKETQSTTAQTCIHPMDIQMAIFHCADDFTRQYILTKLSICQYALPLLVPNPCNSKIELPLWSLTQIRKSWREVEKIGWEKKIKSYNNQLISCQPTHVVSFIRVGNYVSTSKSQILNLLLSKGKHDHFPHHHCREDNNGCFLVEGMVELCWFCPGGRAEDRFENCIAFTNLHGNAETHERQVRFLQEVSSVMVILLSTSDFDKMNSFLLEFLKSPKPLICLFESVENIMDENSAHKVRIGIKNLNKIEIADKITTTLKKLLKNSASPYSLSNWANIARKYEFIIDKDQTDCQEAGEKADILMDILRKVKLSEIKEKLLPLQGGLWHDWCKKDKELHHLREKGNRSIEQYKNEIEMEKQKIRCEQYHKVIILNDLMKTLLESLQTHLDTHTELYFLQGLSMLIDQLTSKELETLHLKYRQLLAQVQTEKQKRSKRDSLRRWESELEIVSRDIRNSTLGIEHLLREVGQIYEALEETSAKTNTLFLSLPQMAADLMISGAPIELMDGDASYVPLKWVAAVFNKVSEKIGNKRVFVLSVLGLQSSGKSTLLNAMFGLQLSLSAGRCTRGAYMQLLKVEEVLREQLGFDFLLLVDTEGLRASEIINSKAQNEENELATFVTGLGNLTLINIFGKDLSEIQDILQITVHAFLRMKQLNISPRCLFVHQNIEEIIDTNESMEMRTRLQEKLDVMALAAAQHEQRSDICHFSDVIHFDAKSHIHYFAHLWEGNPPMAPPNPCYSLSVQELKSRILKHAKESRTSILKFLELHVRIRDLWKALVNENFIFRFRNTQEVLAVTKLETMYISWTWQLRSHVLDLQSHLTSQIQSGDVEGIKRSTLENRIVEKHEAIKQEFEKCFREDLDREILSKWKGRFEKDLKNLKENLVVETLRKCEDQIRGKKIQDLLKEQKVKFEYKLLEKVKGKAFQGTELHDEELRNMFNKVWSESISIPLPPTLPSAEDPDIDIDLENILLEHFKQHPNIVNKVRYRDTKKTFSINYSKHVITSPELQMCGPSLEGFEKEVNKITAQIMTLVKENIRRREQQNEGYSSSYFHEILHVIHTEAVASTKGGRFMLTSRYKLELALALFEEAANSFKKMCIAFRRTNNPVLYLESQKEESFADFKLSYKNCHNTD